MTREELVNSREYQVTSEATERFYNLKNDEENNFIAGFEQGAEWDKEIMIDRACEWLEANYSQDKYHSIDYDEDLGTGTVFCLVDFINDFRKNMEL